MYFHMLTGNVPMPINNQSEFVKIMANLDDETFLKFPNEDKKNSKNRVSKEAKNFIRSLLRVRPEDRIEFEDLWKSEYISHEKTKFLEWKQKKERIGIEMEQNLEKIERTEIFLANFSRKAPNQEQEVEKFLENEEISFQKRKNSFFCLKKTEKTKIIETLRNWESMKFAFSKQKTKFECSFKKNSFLFFDDQISIITKFGNPSFDFSSLPFLEEEDLQKHEDLEKSAKIANFIAEIGVFRSSLGFRKEGNSFSFKILYKKI